MRLHLVSLSFATLLLSLTSAFLPPTLSLSPLVAQAQTNQTRKAIADRLFREGEYLSIRNFERAIRKFNEALLIYQEIGDKVGVGKTLHNIGYVYYNKKEYEQALDYFEQALPIRREVGDGNGQLVTLNLMGWVYKEQGRQLVKRSQYREALEKFQQLLVIDRNLGHKGGEWRTLNQIALAYTNLGEYELALEFYQQAFPISQQVFETSGAIRFNMGRIYEKLGQYELALKVLSGILKNRQNTRATCI
jgi:tetratricopeptide (TPR) repeat protein